MCLNLCARRWETFNVSLDNILFLKGLLILDIFFSRGYMNFDNAFWYIWGSIILEVRMLDSSLSIHYWHKKKKRFWSFKFDKKIHWKYSDACWNFWFVEVSSEYVLVARLKEMYKTYTIGSLVLLGVDAQVPILDVSYHEKNL